MIPQSNKLVPVDAAVIIGTFATGRTLAQDMDHSSTSGMSMKPGAMDESMQMTGTLGAYPMTRESSGTSWQPDDSPMVGIGSMMGSWSTMTHAMATGTYDDQQGPRGDSKVFVTSHFIRQAQQLGFSLDEVSDLLALEDGRHCREAGELGRRKLATVQERIAQLSRIEKVLATVVAQCQRNKGKVRCPLIASLEHDQH